MTTRERAYMHLQNARALYQHLGNQTGDQVAWRAAQVLSLLKCAIDEGDEKTLEAILGSAERFKALTRAKRNGGRKRRADDALGGAGRQDDT